MIGEASQKPPQEWLDRVLDSLRRGGHLSARGRDHCPSADPDPSRGAEHRSPLDPCGRHWAEPQGVPTRNESGGPSASGVHRSRGHAHGAGAGAGSHGGGWGKGLKSGVRCEGGTGCAHRKPPPEDGRPSLRLADAAGSAAGPRWDGAGGGASLPGVASAAPAQLADAVCPVDRDEGGGQGQPFWPRVFRRLALTLGLPAGSSCCTPSRVLTGAEGCRPYRVQPAFGFGPSLRSGPPLRPRWGWCPLRALSGGGEAAAV